MLEHPKKHKYQIGNNLDVWGNQQERLVTKSFSSQQLKWFISGFVDGEGSFCLNVKNRIGVKHGFRIEPGFYVYQHEKSRWFLEIVKKTFNYGSIHRKSSPNSVFTFQIAGIQPCYEVVLPFFEKYPLATKSRQFSLFKEGVEMMFEKKHLAQEGMVRLVHIAYEMNQIGKGRKWQKEELITRILRG